MKILRKQKIGIFLIFGVFLIFGILKVDINSANAACSASDYCFKLGCPPNPTTQAYEGCSMNYPGRIGQPTGLRMEAGAVCNSPILPVCGGFIGIQLELDMMNWSNTCPGNNWDISTVNWDPPITDAECCYDSDCLGECRECGGAANGWQCKDKDNYTSCGSGQDACYSGSCIDPDGTHSDSDRVCWDNAGGWTCTTRESVNGSSGCLPNARGWYESTSKNYNIYKNLYVREDTFNWGNPVTGKCCGDDPGEQAVYSWWCNGSSCPPEDLGPTKRNGGCMCKNNVTNNWYYSGSLEETNNCCGQNQCVSGYSCSNANSLPCDPMVDPNCCYNWGCYMIGGKADFGRRSCSSGYSCNSNVCEPDCECSAGDPCCSDGCNYDSTGTECVDGQTCGTCDGSGSCTQDIPNVSDYTVTANCVYNGATISRPNTNIHISSPWSVTLQGNSSITVDSLNLQSGVGDAVYINSGSRFIVQ